MGCSRPSTSGAKPANPHRSPFPPTRSRRDDRLSGLSERRRPMGLDAANVASWCALILEINSSMDFSVGARGWCYILENRNALRKGDFDVAEKLITDCRKSGLLPLDICAEDDSRETIGLEEEIAGTTVEEEAAAWVDYVRTRSHGNDRPIAVGDWRSV